MAENAGLLDKALRSCTHILRGKGYSIALAVEADKVELIEIKSLFSRIIESGWLGDAVGLALYLSSFAAAGEFALAEGEVAQFFISILAESLKAGVPLDFLSYVLAQDVSRIIKTTR